MVNPCCCSCLAVQGIALVAIGTLGITGALTAHTFGWVTFGLSIVPPVAVAIPIIALLSAYGIIPMVVAGGVTVALGGLLFLASRRLHFSSL